jgi:hypothetical protein
MTAPAEQTRIGLKIGLPRGLEGTSLGTPTRRLARHFSLAQQVSIRPRLGRSRRAAWFVYVTRLLAVLKTRRWAALGIVGRGTARVSARRRSNPSDFHDRRMPAWKVEQGFLDLGTQRTIGPSDMAPSLCSQERVHPMVRRPRNKRYVWTVPAGPGRSGGQKGCSAAAIHCTRSLMSDGSRTVTPVRAMAMP